MSTKPTSKATDKAEAGFRLVNTRVSRSQSGDLVIYGHAIIDGVDRRMTVELTDKQDKKAFLSDLSKRATWEDLLKGSGAL